MNTRWVDKTPPRPFHPLAFGAAILVIIGIALIAFAPFAGANNPPAPNPNDVSYWCPNGGIKYDPASTPFTVPPPPEGRTWTLLVLKAGDENSTPTPNETFVNPTPGTAYSRTDLKSISHAILCQSTVTTTTVVTTPTTQGDDPPTTTLTTIATTTTAATTTTTRPPCVDCVPTQQTAPTTASTLPPGCIDCNIPPPPTTTVASTVTVPFTVAPTVSPAAAPPLATTVALPAASTSASTPTDELPVTGGSPWWLALFGVCLIALGALGWAWTRT